ncbi:MAG: hypothetical protein AVO39_04840 [delta proteobacterium MLS_D]|nr:MAG: hypothetical protein AVO39_04840 [delta proteobacterium MLS_D]
MIAVPENTDSTIFDYRLLCEKVNRRKETVEQRISVTARTCLALIGIAALFVGVLLYLVDRAPDDTYFVQRSLEWLSLHGDVPALFGTFGHVLPGFIHSFSFSLITAGLAGPTRRGAAAICFFWFCLNALFELGQKYKDIAAKLVPGWFEGIPYLENTEAFFRRGIFDPRDIAAMAAGAVAAFVIIAVSLTGRTGPSRCETRPAGTAKK